MGLKIDQFLFLIAAISKTYVCFVPLLICKSKYTAYKILLIYLVMVFVKSSSDSLQNSPSETNIHVQCS